MFSPFVGSSYASFAADLECHEMGRQRPGLRATRGFDDAGHGSDSHEPKCHVMVGMIAPNLLAILHQGMDRPVHA
jgi:hypothetical protein